MIRKYHTELLMGAIGCFLAFVLFYLAGFFGCIVHDAPEAFCRSMGYACPFLFLAFTVLAIPSIFKPGEPSSHRWGKIVISAIFAAFVAFVTLLIFGYAK